MEPQVELAGDQPEQVIYLDRGGGAGNLNRLAGMQC